MNDKIVFRILIKKSMFVCFSYIYLCMCVFLAIIVT